MELGNHTWEHPNMTTLPPSDVPDQLTRANDAIAAASRYLLLTQIKPGSVVLLHDTYSTRSTSWSGSSRC